MSMTACSTMSSRELLFHQEAMPHRSSLFGAAVRLARSKADAEDLVQDTYLKAFRAFEQFEPGTNCKAWLFRILTNSFINRYRRRTKEREILEGKERPAAEHYLVHLPSKRPFLDPENAIADRGLSDEALQALDEVPAEFRDVLLLSDVEGLSYREVAETLRIPVGTVMSRLFRGRRLLQERLFPLAVEQGVLKPMRDGHGAPLQLADYRRRRARSA
ncbi:MAG: sigma-70 family RNA polymerase sigma factor [Myxococcota bacterium]